MMRPLRLLTLSVFLVFSGLFLTQSAKAQCPVVIDSVVVTDVSCPGVNDGSICIYASGGFPDYIFQIFNGPQFFQITTSSTSHCFTGLGAGVSSWVVQVVAQNGSGGTCSPIPSTSVNINDPDPFDIQIATVDESCPDSNDGEASVVVSGGNPPYTYSWPPFPNTGTSIGGLDSGTYDFTVTDSNGCSETVQYTINQEPDWAGTLTGTDVTCNGGTDGEIVSSGITGGTPPYTFLWAPDGQTTEDISGLTPGSYTLTVTDDVGCTFTPPTVVIGEPAPITITETRQNVSCAGLEDGSINITVSGGTAPYTYLWSNGETTEDISGLEAGFYFVTVTDVNGCFGSLPVTIVDGASLDVAHFTATAECGEANGSIQLSVTGGSGNYGYAWQPGGMTTQNVSGLAADIYTVIVTDNTLGCADTLDIPVNNFPGHEADGVVTDGSNCVSNDASIDVTVTDGSGDFSYSWSHGPITQDVSGLATGSYTITVTDNVTGCVAFATFDVQSGQEIAVTGTLTQPACGELNGAIDLTVSGVSGPYTFAWSNGSTAQNLSGLGSGIYGVTVTDVNGCTLDEVFNLSETDAPDVSGVATGPTCSNTANGSITLTVTGGVGPFTFNWSNGSTSQNLTGLTGGTYTVIVTDQGSGCQVIESFTLIAPPSLLGSVNVTNAGCNGASDGSIEANIFGGTPPYTVVWNPGNIVSQNLLNVPADTYSGVATDDNGCTISGTFTITDSPAIVITENITDVSCAGAADGAIDLTVSGGSGGYTFDWLPNGETTEDLSGLQGGSYDVTVTDSDGCTQTGSYVVDEPAPLTLNPTFTDASCNGVCDGEVSVAPTDGTAPYSYVWDPPAGNVPGLTGLCAGSYEVTVTDANGCTDIAQFNISDNQIQISIVGTDVSCNGDCDGTATATITGTNPPFTHVWVETGGTGLSESNLCPNTYTFEVTDNIGCVTQQTVVIGEPDIITLTFNTTDVTCNGGNDGAIDLTVSGGTPGYFYQWFPAGQTTEDLSNLTAGSYSVTVTDANGCTSGVPQSAVVNEPAAIQLATSVTEAACGACDGSVTVTPSNGQAPYTYIWNTGATTATISNVCAGIYQVRVTDANGCDEEFFIPVNNITGPTSGNPVITDASCFSTCDGAATLSPVGGAAPYTYQWVPGGQNTSTVSGLCQGSYFVQIQDADGCIYTEPITIGSPPQIEVGQSVTSSTCGACDGVISLSPITGQAPYSYSWSPPVAGDVPGATGLCAGVYNITVTDATGCSEPVTALVNDIPSATLIMAGTDPGCNTSCDGEATVTTSGGVAPFTYQWDDPAAQTGQTATGLCAGLYTVTVTDGNGCVAVNQVTLNDPAPIGLSLLVIDNGSCAGACDGSITVIPSGGTIPFTYLWDDPGNQTTATASGLCGGVYTVTVTDANGCTDQVTGTVNNPDGLIASVDVTDVTCNGACDGTATANVLGGTPPYTYQWDDPNNQTTDVATGLCPGTYNLIVTDANGCDFTVPAVITEPAALVVTIGNVVNVLCDGTCTGEATANVSGGVGPYDFVWNDGLAQTTPTATGLCASSYTVTVTDANGCVQQATVVLTAPGGLTSSVTSQVNASCNGTCDATATVNATGGTGPYTYQWNDPANQTGPTAIDLCAGIYNVTVTDANDCISITTVTITQPIAINVSTTANDPSCFGVCNGASTAFTSGGTFPYTYQWNDPNGQTNVTAVGLCPGNYDVEVTDVNGCTAQGNVIIFQPLEIIATVNVVEANCGQCNGEASVSPTGGVPPYAYLWGDGQTTQAVIGLCPGVYNVDVTDQFGCVQNFIIPVNNVGGPTSATVNVTDASCHGACDGSASVTDVVDGIAPFTYLWVPGGQTTPSVNGLCAGNYNVQVMDSAGCILALPVTIGEPAQIQPNYSSTPTTCGASNGSIILAPTGGDGGPYTYTWVPNESSGPSATGLAAGIYTVTVTDGSGCSLQVVIPVNSISGPIVNVTSQVNVDCNGSCTGSVTLSVVGGTAPYTVAWNDPSSQTGLTASNLCAGQYSATVTDANGCVTVRQVTITEPTGISFSLPIVTDASCFGACDGEITVVASGGTLPYTVVWSPSGGTQFTESNLCAGTYTADLTDANGCIASVQATVNEPDTLIVPMTITDASCFGICDGEATANPSGGTAPYTYQWDDPASQATQTATGLCAGTYNVTVTDANGCVTVQQVIINEPADIVINASTLPASCFGECDGEAYASATGGTAPYTYQWDDPALTANDTVTGLCAGTYNVIVTDDNGCTSTIAVIITQPDTLIATVQTVDASCPGVCDGSATVTVQGGTGPFTYLWDDPNAQTGDIATGLCAGTYSVTVTDANGCTDVVNVIIDEPTALVIDLTLVDASCNGICDGEASVAVSGGTGPYSIVWSNFSTDNPVTGLCAGSYTVLVADANGCADTVSFTITEPDAIVISTSTLDASCFGVCDGEAYASATGGSGVFTFTWDDPNTTANDTVTGLCAGPYTVTVTDDSGCSATAQVTINEPQDITVNMTTQGVTCFGDCDGQAVASASGGTGPYTYQWDDPNLTANDTVTGLCAGLYNVVVTDANGCTSAQSVLIIEPEPLQLIGQATDITCGGQCDGIATVLVQGGTPVYTYQWDDPAQQTGSSATNLCAGTYTVVVTDDNGCVDSVSVTITEPAVLDASVSVVNPSCGGVCDGEATVNITGGSGSYAIVWSNFQFTSTITGLCAGSYFVIVTDENLCADTVNFILSEPPVLNANITSVTQVLCSGSCTGTATVEGTGGTPPYSYLWSNGQTGPTATDLCVGEHTVTITDDIGCTATASVTINEDNALAAAVPVFTPVSCFGGCNGSATVFPTGGVGPYSYSWNDSFNQTTQTAINLCPGTYTVTVTDSQVPACVTQASVTIGEPAALSATTVSTDETCGGACDGTATVTATGGTVPYTYQWSNAVPPVQNPSSLCVGTYTVTITDANGCTVQNSVTVQGPPVIVANAVTTPSSCSNVANGAIDLTVTGGIGGYTFQWSPGGAVTEDLSGILFGTYTVTITDGTGCELVQTYSVGTQVDINADAGEDMMLCVGSSVNLDGSGGGSYSWSPAGTLSNANAANPSANPTETTTYILTVSIGNCVDTDTVTITMYDVPPVDAGNDVTVPQGGSVGLNALGVVTGWDYEWSPSESLDNPNVPNPFATPLETTMYYVTVTDENGCTNIDSILVEVVPGIKFPDGISPNGDGINDTWVIDNIELFQDAIVEIYNRWGQQLWMSAPGYPIPWDGRYKGENLPVGTYYYVIRSDNFEQPFTGPITLVR